MTTEKAFVNPEAIARRKNVAEPVAPMVICSLGNYMAKDMLIISILLLVISKAGLNSPAPHYLIILL